jgi:cytochrome b6-f complex iron-sulfur subunit
MVNANTNNGIGEVSRRQGSTPRESRRRFVGMAWLGVCAIALAEAVWILVDFLRPRRVIAADDASIVIAGPIDRFEPGTVNAFPVGKFYLVRLEDGGFLALARDCTHLGCTVPWISEENRFVCPCHSSAFDIHGDVIDPPAPRALDRYAIRIENRIVKVDTSQPLRRNRYQSDQVTRG